MNTIDAAPIAYKPVVVGPDLAERYESAAPREAAVQLTPGRSRLSGFTASQRLYARHSARFSWLNRKQDQKTHAHTNDSRNRNFIRRERYTPLSRRVGRGCLSQTRLVVVHQSIIEPFLWLGVA